MKHKTQWLKKLFFFSTAVVLWGSCQNDDGITRPATESEITSRYISLKELKQKTADFENFKEAENKLKKQAKNKSAKMAYDSSLGFYIDTENILLIEKDGYHSYTFPILRDEGEGKIENLVLSFNSGMEMQACISQYDLTISEKELIAAGGTIENLDKKTKLSTLEGNTVFSGDYSGIIWRNPDGTCCRPNNIWVSNGMIMFDTLPVDCPGGDEGGSGSGSSTGGSNGGGAGGSGPVTPPNPESPSNPGNGTPPRGPVTGNPGSNPGGDIGGDNGMYFPTDPVITKPVIPEVSHCAEMKRLIKNDPIGPNLKSTIENVKANVDGYCEHGAQFKKIGNVYSTENLPPEYSGPNADGHLGMTAGAGFYGGIHTHPKICYGMFSFADIFALYQFYRNAGASRQAEVVYMLAVENPAFPNQPSKNSLYALKVDNFSVFEVFIAREFGSAGASGNIPFNDAEQMKDLIDNVDEYLSYDIYDKDMGNLDRAFLKYLNMDNAGISLYQADDAITSWSKISLNSADPRNGAVKKTPCN